MGWFELHSAPLGGFGFDNGVDSVLDILIGDRGCLLQEPRFLGGDCTEVKLEAGLQDREMQRRHLELQVTLVKLQLTLQTSAGVLCTMPGDESHIPGGKNTDDGTILPSVPMTVMAPAETAKDGGHGQNAYNRKPNQAALKLHCVEDSEQMRELASGRHHKPPRY